MNQRSDSMAWRFVDIGVAIIVPLLTAAMGWTASEIYEHGQRLAAIEATRYTSKEAKEDQKLLVEAMNEIKDALHRIDKQTLEVRGMIDGARKDIQKIQDKQ